MSLLSLPPEILELIATHHSLSFRDIYSLSLTCKRIYILVNSSWNIIANTRWSWWPECCGVSNEEWHSLCKQRYLCETKLCTSFEKVIKKGVRLYLTDEEELELFEELVVGEQTKVCTHDLMECVLKEILSKPVSEANLSHQYYGLSLYEYLKRQKLREQLKDLLSRPNKEQLLIKAAILFSQWIDPLNSYTQEDINEHIIMIATEVAKDLLKIDTDSCSSLPSSQCMFDNVKQSNIPCLDILKAMNRVIFIQLGFKPAPENQPNGSLINQIVKRQCVSITLSTIYQAVADRLGVTLLPVNFPAHFLLKAPQNLITGEGEIFVDAYGRGQLLSQEDCLGLVPFLTVPQPDMFNPVDPYKAMIRMVANIYSRGHHHSLGLNFNVGRQWNEVKQQWGPIVLPSALALQLTLCWISPLSDFTRQVAADAANIALDLRFNVKQVVWVMSDMLAEGNSIHVLTKLQRAQTQAEKRRKVLVEPTRVKQRDASKVVFTIGNIMKHLRYNYRCVIYGWDLRCEMGPTWIEQMGVHHLSLGPNQPFYNVLVEDGTNRYAAQESLFPCPVQELAPIRHWEVGKYFEAYKGDRYIPNNALSEKYPPTDYS